MPTKKIKSEEDTWQQVITDLKEAPVPLQYKTVFGHNDTSITLVIDMDPGGGFEGGFEFTSLSAPLPIQFTSLKASVSKTDFRFALHDEGVMDRVGKVFGMEDTHIGFPEFDKQLIVKTNDAARVKKLFSNAPVRKVFQALSDFTFQISHEDGKGNPYTLEFMIDRAITDPKELRKLYNAFAEVLDKLDIP
jgi:hypothetical protein